MKINNYITSIILIFISINTYSQSSSNTSKKNKNEYTFCYNDETKEWTKVNSELYNLKKEGKLEALQYKLKNLNYDVDITNRIDKNTTEAFEAEQIKLKNKKKSERFKRKEKRKNKRLKKKTNAL